IPGESRRAQRRTADTADRDRLDVLRRDAERGRGRVVGEFQSFGQKPLDVAVLGDERRTMRVDDEDRALKTVKLFHGELDQGLERGESPFGCALPLLDARRYGQAANTESEPELFGIVIGAVECAVRVADGEQERHDRMSK